MTCDTLIRKRRRRLSSPSPPIVGQKLSTIVAPALPMTPPDPGIDPLTSVNTALPSLDTVVHVISTERAALGNLERLYATDGLARDNMGRAVDRVASIINGGGKLVICGVGKSGKIGEKLVATMNSFGIQSCFLHPTEALHGDLGMIRPNDAILFITFSGKTSELLMLLPHLPPTLPVIAITSHMQPSSCALLVDPDLRDTILLPAPVHEREEISFGVPAPTTSTAVALAVGDALALAIARKLHTVPGRGPAEIFKGFHPGGAIGMAFASSSSSSLTLTPSLTSASSTTNSPSSAALSVIPDRPSCITPFQLSHQKLVSDIATPISSIPVLSQISKCSPLDVRIAEALAAAIRCPKANFWVFVTPDRIIPPAGLRTLADVSDSRLKLCDLDDKSHAFPLDNCIRVPESSSIVDVRQILKGLEPPGEAQDVVEKKQPPFRNRVIVTMGGKSHEEMIGFVEESEIWQADV